MRHILHRRFQESHYNINGDGVGWCRLTDQLFLAGGFWLLKRISGHFIRLLFCHNNIIWGVFLENKSFLLVAIVLKHIYIKKKREVNFRIYCLENLQPILLSYFIFDILYPYAP
jgi:hypothetical protein